VAPRSQNSVVEGILVETSGIERPFTVTKTMPHSLIVSFEQSKEPNDASAFANCRISLGDKSLELGAGEYHKHPALPRRRKDDPPPEPGHGRLVFSENIWKFSSLRHTGRVTSLQQRVQQLPLLWKRKELVCAPFRQYTLELLYDLQVYRAQFDSVDRGLARETEAVRERVSQTIVDTQYGAFSKFLDRKLDELALVTRHFDRYEHECHGFFFRKQLWDIILSAAFMARTNLKPRGYAGDSTMMDMIYKNAFIGSSSFARFMHYHPLQHPGSCAVRNRRKIVVERMREMSAGRDKPLRIISIACGPARELLDLFAEPEDLDRYHLVLLDQDPEAIAEAKESTNAVQEKLGRAPTIEFIHGSVRTLSQALAKCQVEKADFLYTMGLFDYLTPPVARSVLGQLATLLQPNGSILLGNFHPENPSRTYMEYWLDWVLFYRNEEDLISLTRGLPVRESRVFLEPDKAQLFMEMKL